MVEVSPMLNARSTFISVNVRFTWHLLRLWDRRPLGRLETSSLKSSPRDSGLKTTISTKLPQNGTFREASFQRAILVSVLPNEISGRLAL